MGRRGEEGEGGEEEGTEESSPSSSTRDRRRGASTVCGSRPAPRAYEIRKDIVELGGGATFGDVMKLPGRARGAAC